MNKNDLIADVAKKAGLSKTDAAKAVDAFIASVTGALKKGDESPFIDGVCSKAEILSNNWFE